MIHRHAARAVLFHGLPCLVACLCSVGCAREETVEKVPAPAVAAKSGVDQSSDQLSDLQPMRSEKVEKVPAAAVQATSGLDESAEEDAQSQPASPDEHDWDTLLGDLKKTAADKFPAAAEQVRRRQQVLIARRDALKTLVAGLREEYAAGSGDVHELYRALEQLHSVELQTQPEIAKRIELRSQYLGDLKSLQQQVQERLAAGEGSKLHLAQGQQLRLGAEVALADEKTPPITPEELASLQRQAEQLEKPYLQARALSQTGGVGGSVLDVTKAGREFWTARAAVALARGDRYEALKELRVAADFAHQAVASAQTILDTGGDLGVGRSVLDVLAQANVKRQKLLSHVLRLERQLGPAAAKKAAQEAGAKALSD